MKTYCRLLAFLLLWLLPGLASAQGFIRFHLAPSWLVETTNSVSLKNGLNPQTVWIYNEDDGAGAYERVRLGWESDKFKFSMQAAGGGSTNRVWLFDVGHSVQFNIPVYPASAGTKDFGHANLPWRSLYLNRSTEGSESKDLTESSATQFATVAVPQTAGSNYAGGVAIWTVSATDGTDSQSLQGRAEFAAVNKAGTESCEIDDNQITTEASSSGTLACTLTCVTGLTDVVGLAANCVSSLTQTTLKILYRLDMPKTNTVTPET